MNDLDNDKNLYTSKGMKIPELNISPKSYIDKTIVIYGPTKTGKTVITKNIMRYLSDYIDQILVISPTEPSNRSYEGFVDPPLIHYKIYNSDNSKNDWKVQAFNFLESIWKRQEMMASIYTNTNKLENLQALFKYVVPHIKDEANQNINRIKLKLKNSKIQINKKYTNEGIREENIKKINNIFTDMLIQIYKKYIYIDYKNIWESNLTNDERYTLQYIYFNPRLLLIFDDCAAQLKPFFSREIFRKLFYQNRHSYITVILCCQDDTDLPANLRKNAFINFYTEPRVCLSNFDRISNKYSKEVKQYINEIINVVFKGYRKLAYIREDDKNINFYHVTFEYPNLFKFGSKALHELCNIIQTKDIIMDKENPYYDLFKL